MRPLFHVELKTPDGSVYDVTDRVDGDAVSSLTEETDETLLTLTHSDMTLTLANRDGFFTRLFAGAKPGDAYEATIDRFAGRAKWERVFGGTLDFPWSVTFDDDERTCAIQAFAFTKLLEGASADGYRRNYSGATGTVAASSTSLALTSTAGLAAGDKITLSNGTASETQALARVVDATHAVTVAAFANAFTNAPATLATPYYRGQTTAQLAAGLAALAGISSVSVTIPAAFASTPFPTPMNSQGLPTGTPDSVLEKSASIYVYQGGSRYYSADASSAFVSAGSESAKQDWRPYLASEPATLQALGGDVVVDYVDAAHPTYSVVAESGGDSRINFNLYKNGAFVATMGYIPAGSDAAPTLDWLSWDLAPAWGEIWASWRGSYTGPGGGRADSMAVVRFTTAGVLRSRQTSWCGYVRSCDGGTRMAVSAADCSVLQWSSVAGVHLYQSDGSEAARLADPRAELVFDSFRRVGSFYCVIVDGFSYSGVAVWDAASGALLAIHRVADAPPGTSACATCFADGGAIAPEYDGFTGGSWFSVSTRTSGVIPYADFSGMSCAEALAQLALMNAAVLEVTPFRELRITSRSLVGADRDPIPLGVTLEQTRRPVWESYRAFVKVTGKTEADADVEALAGAIGDSAHELDVDVRLPLTDGLAGALAQAYAAWFGAVREQRDVTVAEPDGGPARLFDRVSLDDRVWRVAKAQIDLFEKKEALQLIAES